MCSGTSRRASRRPCTFGCSVFTRPSSISGKPVTSATSVTGSAWSARSLAVPPVEISLMPSACRACASSTMPVLSETEMSAFMSLFQQTMLDELLAQGVAIEAQPLGGLGLVVVCFGHHHFEQRFFHHLHQHFVHPVRLRAAQVLEVALQARPHALLDVLLAHCTVSNACSSLSLAGAAAGMRS